jgi:hypothetical protein
MVSQESLLALKFWLKSTGAGMKPQSSMKELANEESQ